MGHVIVVSRVTRHFSAVNNVLASSAARQRRSFGQHTLEEQEEQEQEELEEHWPAQQLQEQGLILA